MKDGVIAVVAGKEIKQEEFDVFVENLPQDRKAYLQYPGFKERLLVSGAVYIFCGSGGTGTG